MATGGITFEDALKESQPTGGITFESASAPQGVGAATVLGSSFAKGMSDSMNPAKIASSAVSIAPRLANAFFPGIGKIAGPAASATAGWLDRAAPVTNPARFVAEMPFVPPVMKEAVRTAGEMSEKTPEEVAAAQGITLSPTLSALAKITGGMGAAAGSFLPFGIVGAAKNAPGLLKAALGNLGYGALSGAGEVAGNALGGPAGAVIGSILPALLPAGAATGIAAGKKAIGAIHNVATIASPSAAERVTGGILSRTGFNPGAEIPAPPLPGMRGTVGMRTANPDLISLERAAMERSNQLGMREGIASTNKGIVADTLSGMAGHRFPEAISPELAASYRNLQGQVKGATGIEAATAALEGTSIPSNVLKGYVNKYVNGLKIAQQNAIPATFQSTLDKIYEKYPQTIPFGEIQALNSDLKQAARNLAPGDKNKIVLNGLASHLNNLFAYKQSGVMEAFSKYGQYKKAFEDNPLVGQLFEKSAPGFYKVPGTEFAAKAFRSPDEAIQYLGSLPAQEAKRLGKEYLVSTLADSIRQGGAPTANDMRRFIQSNRAAIKNFFTPDDQSALKRVHDAIDFSDRFTAGAVGPGSQTYRNFMAGSFLDKSVKVMTKIPFVKGITKDALESLRTKVDELLTRAAFDPDLARALTKRASAGNVSLLQKSLSGKNPTYLNTLARIAAMNFTH